MYIFMAELKLLLASQIIQAVTKIFIPESFNTNISHQLFNYKITFVNSRHEDANSEGDFVVKTWS